MSSASQRPPQFPTEDEMAQAKEAGRQLARMLPEGQRPLRLVTENNQHEMISIPPGAVRLFLDVLTQLGQGRGVTILPKKAELTTQEVADFLNVSRPYVVKLIDSGALPARTVGTRRRVAFHDLIKFDEADRKRRRAALNEIAQIDQELGI
jgi:excisionase family DNA binding protein